MTIYWGKNKKSHYDRRNTYRGFIRLYALQYFHV